MTTPAAADRTNLFGWLGIVLGLLCCGTLGIIFGALSLQQAKRYANAPTLGHIAIGVGALNIVVGGLLAATGHYPGRW